MDTGVNAVPGAAEDGTAGKKQMRRILASSFLGSAIEFYDFLLYATAAAIVFPTIFFEDLSPAMASFAAFGTLAAGYAARPLGGIVFGHFGDRVGRKGALVVSMLAIGFATLTIGLLPSTEQVGPVAVVLLLLMRILQGLAVGGEWGGAMLIAIEHAPGGKRGFAASFANLGAPAGSLLAAGAMLLATLLPDEEFFSWGWRIPFLASLVLVGIGMYIRLKVAESPLFQQFEVEAEHRRIPIVEVLTRHSRKVVLGLLVAISQLTISGMVAVWAVNFAVQNGAEKTGVLNAKTLSAIVLFLFTFITARYCDRFGRKPIMGIGIAAGIIFAYPMLLLVQSGSVLAFTIAIVVGQAIQGTILGPLAAFLAELFPTTVRFTGASLCFQGASTLGAGFTPVIAAALVAATGGSVTLVGLAWIAVLALSLIALIKAPDGQKQALADIR